MSNNIQSQIYQLQPLYHLPPDQQPQPNVASTQRTRIFNIPHITKRMNNVEKYVSKFRNITTSVSRTSDRNLLSSLEYNRSLAKLYMDSETSNSNSPQKQKTSIFMGGDSKDSQKMISSVIYSALNSKDSLKKVNSLNRLSQTYARMKDSINVRHHLPLIRNSHIHQQNNRSDSSGNEVEVTEQQIQTRLKGTMVQQEGKKYFGDLYFLKKGRDRVMQSLESIGKHEGSDLKTYDNIVHDVKNYNSQKHESQQQAKMKILRERVVNKHKMLTNKRLHWNVYYDMFALGKHQKTRVQNCSRFGVHYGIN